MRGTSVVNNPTMKPVTCTGCGTWPAPIRDKDGKRWCEACWAARD